MKKTAKNKLAMYKAVKSVIEMHNAEWSGLVAFSNVFDTYTSKLVLFEQKAFNQHLALVGVKALKDAKQEMVAERAYAIKSSLAAYAVVTNKVDLINQLKMARWDLLKGQRNDVMQRIDLIIAKATEFLSELGDFGVDQASLDDLISLRNELEVQLGAPRNAIVDRKVLTQQVYALIRELNDILRLQLDPLMEVLREEHPDFFISYKNARIIVDYRNRRGTGSSINEELPPEPDDGTGSFDEDF